MAHEVSLRTAVTVAWPLVVLATASSASAQLAPDPSIASQRAEGHGSRELPAPGQPVAPPSGATATSEPARPGPSVNIPFTKTTLPNGMVVILSEAHAVPQVVVNTTYRVGSAKERPGRTGFAHLFEHLMFMGTRRAPRGAFDAWMEQAGGRNNAWTAEDRTDYYDIAPPTALPLLLWLEADRMRDLGHDIDEEKLDLQRDVVLNERRQNVENRPYGVEQIVLPELLWPEGSPYHHPVIGSPADLKAATVADVKGFFQTWYDPANASLVIAGDFDPQQARADINRWFAPIPSDRGATSRPPPSTAAAAAPLAGVVRKTVPDDVELAKVTLAWRSPPHFAPGDAEMDLLASVLSSGKESRLYESLVYDQKIATDVSAEQRSHVLESAFVVEASVRPGVDPARVEKALFEQIGRLRTGGVLPQELDRAKNEYEMSFVDGLQSMETRASLLNDYQAELGDPGYVQRDLDRYEKAGTGGLLTAARKILRPDAVVVLTIVPKKGSKP